MAYVTINLNAEQGISGIGFFFFGLGMSDLLFQKLVGKVETVQGFAPIYIPVLSDIPYIGKIFFSQNIMVYGAYLLVPIALFVLNRTTLGLKIRSVGENPDAANSLGVSVAQHALFYGHHGRRPFRDCRRFSFHRVIECLSAEHDQRHGLYCCGPGLFWRLAPTGCVERCTVVQHGQCSAIVDPGQGHSISRRISP